jgi:hypothetical protein
VLRRALITIFFLAVFSLAMPVAAQQEQPSPSPHPTDGKPQVKVNYLNVCAPNADEQAIIKSGLAAIQPKPAFSPDFEISRGRTSMKDAPDAKYVRLRRDFTPESPLVTAQYSISTDTTNTIEVLVLHARDPKEFLEVILESRVSAGAAAPQAVLQVDTPASRVRVERLNKSSAVLTRCQDADQSAYEPVFHQATEIMAQYRSSLGLRTAFHSDIAWLSTAPKPSGTAKKKPAARH